MVEFLSPLGWVVASAAVLPITAGLLRDRRERTVRGVLGLAAPGRRARFATAAAGALAVALLAAATARPAVRTSEARHVRTDAQVYFVVDTSRSMLARRGLRGETRFARALGKAMQIRARLAQFPAGVASLTDRPLPHLFPTADEAVFASVLHKALDIQRPPPESPPRFGAVSTAFDPLAQFAVSAFFSPGMQHKLVILLSDGESRSYSAGAIGTQLRAQHVGLLVVRFWHADERVYTGGRSERYRPEPRSIVPLRRLAAATSGRPVFQESDVEAIAAATRGLLGEGPSVALERPNRVELAPYAAVAALLPIVFVLRRRDR